MISWRPRAVAYRPHMLRASPSGPYGAPRAGRAQACQRGGLVRARGGHDGCMRPIRTLARPLMAAPFVVTGIETLRDPGRRAERIAPVIKPLADRVSWLPSKDPETLVRMQGALSVGSGALLAMGRFERLSTLVLAGQLVPSLLAEHRFWAEDDPDRRAAERSQFFKTAGLF